MANQFNAEVFDCGLLNNHSRISVSNKAKKDKGAIYRIFQSGDQTPTSDDDTNVATSIKEIDIEHFTGDHRKGIFTFYDSSSEYDSEEDKPKKSKSFKDLISLSLSRKQKSPVPAYRESSITQSTVSRDSFVESPKESTTKERDSISRKVSAKESTSIFKGLLMPTNSTRRSSTSSQDDFLVPAAPLSRSSSEISLEEKYGNTESVLGKGSFATVKLCCASGSKEKYAVKEFRKKKKEESEKDYMKKMQAEFCIASSMDNENVCKSVDLIQDSHHKWCVVMEYCQGGDLFSRISNGSLSKEVEKNCYFAQLIHGVQYLHTQGVAHRDLKPENLLIDNDGHILKITDFGVSTVFRSPFGTISEKRRGIAGSGPYIAPEEYNNQEYEPEKVDIWSVGVIGYVMNTNGIPWQAALPNDPRFKQYCSSNKKFKPFERLHPGLRNLLYKMLDPNPESRCTMNEILQDEWLLQISYCTKKKYSDSHSHESRRR